MHKQLSLAALAIALVSHPAAAQDAAPVVQDPAPAPPEVEAEVTGNEIIVTGRSLRGRYQGAESPIVELDSEDIAAYGAGSIEELIEQLAPQTGSNRGRGGGDGRPVFLVNGLRVSSWREFRSYPPEAIETVEVLPEEAAQQYGFPPNQRVINFIMKENFSSREVELEYEQPDRGGYSAQEVELTYLKLGDESRMNANLEFNNRTLLTEGERDIVQAPGSVPTVAGDPDPAFYRSLVGESRSLEATGNYTTRIGGAGTVSGNLTYERNEGRSLSGLDSVLLTDAGGGSAFRTFNADDPLERRNRSDSVSAGLALNTVLDGWDVAGTLDATRVWSETEIDRRADTADLQAAALAGTLALDAPLQGLSGQGFDLAASNTFSGVAKATFRGTPLTLPAGEVSTTFDLGADYRAIDSSDTRGGGNVSLDRRRLSAGANLTVPVAERGFAWGAIGDLSLNLRAGVEDVSDFGTLGDYSIGLVWGPFENLTLSATHIGADAAPSLTQLGAPVTQTFNVPTFDFATGDTVLVTTIDGGNPGLVAETQRDWKFAANWELPFWEDARLNVEYFDNHSEDVSTGFPLLTPAIEAAFPDRIVRDGAGQLVSIDRRPITLAQQDSRRLSVGLNLRGSFGQATPEPAEDRGPPPGAGRGGRGARGAGGGAEGEGGGFSPERREQFAAFRERLCADDGTEWLQGLIAAIDNGEVPESMPEGFDAEQAARFLDRIRGEDGSIDPERLTQFRERICAMDPAAMAGGRRGGGEGRRGGGRRGGGNPFGGGDGRGRYFVNLTYNRELANTVLIADGGPTLDLLAGDALSGGGVTRDSASLEAGAFRNGWGLRASSRYSGPSTVRGSGLPGSTDLFFGDLVTFDLRVFADLGEILSNDGWAKGMRVSLRADNILDTRREVLNSDGVVPIGYQPFLIDPTGRYLGVELRKLF